MIIQIAEAEICHAPVPNPEKNQRQMAGQYITGPCNIGQLRKYTLGFWSRCCRCCARALDRSTLDQMIVAAFLLKQLGEMVLAVQNAFKSSIVRGRDGAATVGAFETGLVIRLALNCYLFKGICSLATSGTFFLGSRKHSSCFARSPSQNWA